MRTCWVVTMVAAMLGVASAAGAISLNDTITCTGVSTRKCSASSAVVGAGSEFAITRTAGRLTSTDFTLDFSDVDNSLTITTGIFSVGVTPGTPFYLAFSDLTNPFTNVNFVSATNTVGVDASNFSVVNGELRFNIVSPADSQSQYYGATIRLNFDAATGSAAPEPATWATMLGGFGMVGAALRRRRHLRPSAA